ncbi:outer membrane beta-barrel protein [Pelotalea chapellei]|uniref:Outer membrane beta-barrel protein n=1 Tax=Pelotalea chapellei TaxID=44671 RepID=A0ABS5U9N4_9BACT|nr:outer membrane beta-barrel protein [Pelotalea chapellei]MBT1072397.1 outer membrane beta-barrel protein [Pelotalea chapellei]
MKKLIAITCLATTIMASGSAMADSIKGKVGVTGRLGFLIPSDNETDIRNNRTDAGFIGGGGVIYGIDDHFAAELDITRAMFGSDTGDFGVTNYSLGGQYRFALPNPQFVPYAGLGLDILVSDYDPDNGTKRDVDTTVGFHVSGGVDYFILKQVALTGEAKFVVAPDTSITSNGSHRGDFDPTSFSSTVGIRYFFN